MFIMNMTKEFSKESEKKEYRETAKAVKKTKKTQKPGLFSKFGDMFENMFSDEDE